MKMKMKANRFLVASCAFLLLQSCMSHEKSTLIRRRLGSVELGGTCENACDCKGFPSDKVCCERRGKGDTTKKCYPCKKGGTCVMAGGSCTADGQCCTKNCKGGECQKIAQCVLGEKSFINQAANQKGYVEVPISVAVKAPLRYVKICMIGEPLKFPHYVSLYGKCDGDSEYKSINFYVFGYKAGKCNHFHISSIGGEVVDYDHYKFVFNRTWLPPGVVWKLTGKITLYGKCNEK